jgi:ElaB/YqjD/DUF883 family membrane-anchored ribosome-binding protein
MNAALDMVTAGDGVFPMRDAKGPEFAQLFDGVDDLIHRVAHTECPEIRKLRAKVYASMVAAKHAFDDDADRTPVPAARIDSTERSLPGYPGQGFGVAFLVGLGVGFISSLRQEG